MSSPTSDPIAPLFIHAPWRSGSTFLFELFRRHQDRFYCFQEPLNDWSVHYRDEPEKLLGIDASLNAGLRHPSLAQPYFQELHDVHAAWAAKLDKAMLYDDYFGGADGVDTAGFFKALIEASPRQPVIQECRTLGRIGALKARLGGYHLAALRNPIDLWWSQKVNTFFTAGRALIINAAQPPSVIERFRERVGFQAFHDADLMIELDHFRNGHLDGANSYLELHLIWSLAVIEAVQHADLVINMDQLSADPAVAAGHVKTLEQAGFGSIALSECRMPLRRLTQPELDRFTEIEALSFGLLEEAGEPVELIWAFLAETATPRPVGAASDDQREAAQYREVVWRQDDQQAQAQRRYLEVMASSEGLRARIIELEQYYVDLSGAVRELDERLAKKRQDGGLAQRRADDQLADLAAQLRVAQDQLVLEGQRLMEREATLAQTIQHLAERETVLSETEQRLAEQAAARDQTTQLLAEREMSLARTTQQLVEREASLAQTTQHLAAVEGDWLWRSTRFLRRR